MKGESPKEGKGRKRQNSEEWTKTKKKIARNSKAAKGKPQILCKHKTTFCEAANLAEDDITGISRILRIMKNYVKLVLRYSSLSVF